MRLLLDANLSPRIAARVTDGGFPTRHVRDLGLVEASDEVIFDRPAADAHLRLTWAASASLASLIC